MIRYAYLFFFAVTVLVFIAAPVLAIPWENRLFPGFLVEQSSVVTDLNGASWSGRNLGISHPQKITHVNGIPVPLPVDLYAQLEKLPSDQPVRIDSVFPDGTSLTTYGVQLVPLPRTDMLRIFWLPYVVGFVYLILAVWVYLLRGELLAARIFIYFCLCTAITLSLLFDLFTTHRGVYIWTFTVTQLGGALCSLALVFPYEPAWVTRRMWLRLIPYGISVVIAIWGIIAVFNPQNSWAYIPAWRAGYYFISFSILFFIGMTITRLHRNLPALVRQQAQVILFGALVAFVPLAMWFSAPLLDISLRWNPGFYIPFLLVFPISIGLAIQRYRLWDFDILINRVLVYTTLTVALILVYLISALFLQILFLNLMREYTFLVTVLSTVVVVALFNPLRTRVQRSIDRRFYRKKYDAARTLEIFADYLRREVDLDNMTTSLVNVIQDTMQPSSIAVDLFHENKHRMLEANQSLDPLEEYLLRIKRVTPLDEINLDSPALLRYQENGVRLLIPLVWQEELIGVVKMGPRLSGQMYSSDDQRLLDVLANQAASSLHMAQLVKIQKSEALERQTIEQEFRLARLVQQTQLPQHMPVLSGWKFATHYQPARATGGDFYDFTALQDGRLGVAIGDVTDKVMPAALVMAQTRSLLCAAALQYSSPGQVLSWVNEQLHPEIPHNMFVTCFYVILDPLCGELSYANAGHNPPYRALDGHVQPLFARGFPLGIMPGASYEVCQARLRPGESMLLYSDGLVEAHNSAHEMLGDARLRTVMNSTQNGEGLIESLLSALRDFTGVGWEQEDDVTLVAIQRMIDQEDEINGCS